MKKKRVGTFTLALVFIVSGVLMLVSQILNISALTYFIKFWPLTFFLLGGEVIYFHFKYRKDEEVNIGYDFFSIIIILLIIVTTFGLNTIINSGVLEGIKNFGEKETKVYKLEKSGLKVSENIEKIIVENMENTDVEIKTGKEDELDIVAEITLPSINDKDKEIDLENLIKIEESGKVLYLTLDIKKSNEIIDSLYNSKINITVPVNLVLDISKVRDVNMRITELNEDILINNANNVILNIDNPIDYKVLAFLGDDERFLGMMDWDIKEEKNKAGDTVYFVGEARSGDSENTIKILNSRSIEANSL